MLKLSYLCLALLGPSFRGSALYWFQWRRFGTLGRRCSGWLRDVARLPYFHILCGDRPTRRIRFRRIFGRRKHGDRATTTTCPRSTSCPIRVGLGPYNCQCESLEIRATNAECPTTTERAAVAAAAPVLTAFGGQTSNCAALNCGLNFEIWLWRWRKSPTLQTTSASDHWSSKAAGLGDIYDQ